MGYLQNQIVDNVIDTATLVTTAETVVGSLVVPSNLVRDTPVDLEAYVALTTGASVTAVVARIREDSLTGTLVGVAKTVQIAQSLPTGVEIAGRHSPSGEIANKSYVVTLQQTAATGNGSVQGVVFRAWCQP